MGLALLLLALLVPSSLGEGPTPVPEPERFGVWFGYSLARLGDVDGDGATDFAVGSPLDTGGGAGKGYAPGRVLAISGGTAEVLWAVESAAGFGKTVVELGDLDRDGVTDLGVTGWSTRATLLSGATGETLRVHTHPTAGRSRHTVVASLPDVDGDDVDDVVVSRSFSSGIYVHSGASGAMLSHVPVVSDGSMGTAVIGIPDVDGDGAGDIVTTRWTTSARESEGGSGAPVSGGRTEVVVLSGVTGEELRTLALTRPSTPAQVTLRLVGDLDGDQESDIAIACAMESNHDEEVPGVVELRSVRTGATLRVLADDLASAAFGYSLDLVRDSAGGSLLVTQYGMGVLHHPTAETEVIWEGRLYTFSLGSGERRLVHEGRVPYGRRVLSLGDVDSDDVADYAVSTTFDRAGAFEQGYVSVHSGATDEQLYRVPPEWR